MHDQPEERFDIPVTISATKNEFKALEELGQWLASDGHPTRKPLRREHAMDLAVHFIVTGALWAARKGSGQPGKDEA